jgi:hypothetical protein
MRRLEWTAAGFFLFMALGGPGPVFGQNVTIDEGTFRLLVNGREVGNETFAIGQTGAAADAQVFARSRVTLEAGTDTSLVQYGPSLRAAAYSIQVGGEPGEHLSGRVAGRRVSARIISSAGEKMREYLVAEGAVVIGDGVAHQNYFLARRVREGETRIPVIVPRETRQMWFNVEVHPDETVDVGGTSIACNRLVLTPDSGDVRNLWVDSSDRVLRLEIPARHFVAERTSPPR